jgi:hypothetical protein
LIDTDPKPRLSINHPSLQKRNFVARIDQTDDGFWRHTRFTTQVAAPNDFTAPDSCFKRSAWSDCRLRRRRA